MNEKDFTCFNQYQFDFVHIKKARGALICEDANRDLYMLQECFYSQKRMDFENQVLSQLRQINEIIVDDYIPNKEGELISCEPNGNTYLLKKWISTKECEIRNIQDAKESMRALARLHKAMQKVIVNKEYIRPFNLLKQWEKRYMEMRRIRSFITKKKKKSDFELLILHTIDEYLKEAKCTIETLQKMEIQKIPIHLCHGDYNYHNILFTKKGIMITQFHQMYLGYQVFDIYYFMRKFLEKNNWEMELAKELLTSYQEERLLSDAEQELLYLHFAFPDKYWKQVNRYMNSSKNWIPDRYFVKLKEVCIQQQSRKEFLEKLRKIMYNDVILKF